jgi:hypothetical protein
VAIIFVAILKLSITLSRGLPIKTNSTVAANPKQESLYVQPSNLMTENIMKGNVTYYRLSKSEHYHFEFRFELNTISTNDEQRLIILLNGKGRSCVDYWEFPVGRRLLSTFRAFNYSILAICSARKEFNIDVPIQKNPDVQWIYLSLQKWMNEIYYKRFQRYPRLYIHSISRGSKFAPLLARVLPIQAQILSIFPGHWEAMFVRSDYHIDMQTRLALDPVFANWFYFDFCYNTKINKSDLCPFQNNRQYFQPVAPTYFIHSQNDQYFKEPLYKEIILNLRKAAFYLGGILLNHTQAIQLYILPPAKATSTYMQEVFEIWHLKPHASQIFFEHFNSPQLYQTENRKRRTCICSPIDFKYFEQFPNITQTWSREKQEKYSDYLSDVRQFEKFFCEDVCGDLMACHAISARDTDKALYWANQIDHLRHSYQIKDYLTRPLRIWMYQKKSLITNATYFSSHDANWVNMSKPYQMYSPEYYLQDYFQRLNASRTLSNHNLKWTDDPLISDYFIIPSDLMFHYFYHEPANMTDLQIKNLRDKLNIEYFEPLFKNIRTTYPYWTMAKRADQIGSNHILAILGDINMGLLHEKTQKLLTNVIQLVVTGVRQDMLLSTAQSQYVYRSMPIVYRHRYDVVIPQFTRLRLNESAFSNLNLTLQKKKTLFVFAGTLNHLISPHSAHMKLLYLWQDIRNGTRYKMMTQIQGRRFDTIKVVNDRLQTAEYVESVYSSVFSLCPEGLLPWSPYLYESLQLAAIPIILADGIVLPFERFINWRSFSIKLNVSNIGTMIDLVTGIKKFDMYVKEKLENATVYLNAFRWPYSTVGNSEQTNHTFLPLKDMNGRDNNVFHYISLELRCRRLEQLYGLTSEGFSAKSMDAQQQACKNHATICPCHNERLSLAFQEYI